MTAPLTGAIHNASYTGAFGSDAGAAARLVANLVAGAKAEQQQREAAAMQQALLKLKLDDSAWTHQHGDAELQASIANQKHDNELADKQFGAHQANADRTFGLNKQNVDSEMADRSANRGLEAQRLAETNRHNLAIEGIQAEKPQTRGLVVQQNQNGDLISVDKTNGTITPILDANGHPVKGSGARPNSGEQQNAMLYKSIEPSLGRIDNYFATHNAPSVAAQALAEHSGSGLTGGVSNVVLSAVDPDYQKALTDIIGVYRAYVYATTGKQLNESEAQDAKKQFTILAGDTEATKRQKLGKIHQMADAVRAVSQRALNFQAQLPDETGGAAQTSPSGATPSARAAQIKARYGLE